MNKRLILALAALSLSGPALAENMKMGGSAADKAYMHAMEEMHNSMQAMKATGDANRDFVTMMKHHGQAAVGMAKAYLKYGSDPQLKAMARSIISSQAKEIRQMEAWQARHAK